MENNSLSKYHKSLVIFIDILETKDNNNFDSLFKVNKLFRKLTKEQEEQDNKEHNLHRIYKRTIFSFSDCAYIIYDYKDGIEENRKNDTTLSWVALYNTVYMLQELIKDGYVFRGGITFGDVYYDKNENIVFGPAIVEAYELESKYAKNPRVLIQDNLATKILKYHNDIKDKLKSKKNICPGISSINGDNGEIINKDFEDSKYYINYFNNIDCDKEKLKKFILGQLKRAKNKNSIKLMKKYFWLSEYYKNEVIGIEKDYKSVMLMAAGLEKGDEFSKYKYIIREYELEHNNINITLNKQEYDFIKSKDENYINNLIISKMSEK